MYKIKTPSGTTHHVNGSTIYEAVHKVVEKENYKFSNHEILKLWKEYTTTTKSGKIGN